MPKRSSFETVRLYQIDYENGVQDDLSVFVINGDGSWYESYQADGITYASGGSLTSAELRTLSKLFREFEKDSYDDGPVVGQDITMEDYYSFDATTKAKHRDFDFDRGGKDSDLTNASLFYNVIYDDGAAPALEYGTHETVSALNTYMQNLDAKYGHGLII